MAVILTSQNNHIVSTNLLEMNSERKDRSIALLKDKSIYVIDHLPEIESENETTIRTAREISERVCILCITNLLAFESIENEDAIEYLKENELWDKVTEKEKDFLINPTDDKKTSETWKCEAIWVLMWALKYIDKLDFPTDLCDLNELENNYPLSENSTLKSFIEKSNEVRTKSEILDEADFIYRLNWACVDSRIKGKELEEVHPGIVYERHYTLNWLINYMNQEWDDITCDT